MPNPHSRLGRGDPTPMKMAFNRVFFIGALFTSVTDLRRCLGRRRSISGMARLSRFAAGVATIGTLMLLSACGTSVPAAVGSYKVTFVVTKNPGSIGFIVGSPDSAFSLALNEDGHFVMKPSGHAGATFKGTWSQSEDVVTLNSSKNRFVARLNGKNLQKGLVAYLGRPPPTGASTLSWSAVRTG